jgi:hypothetical protein
MPKLTRALLLSLEEARVAIGIQNTIFQPPHKLKGDTLLSALTCGTLRTLGNQYGILLCGSVLETFHLPEAAPNCGALQLPQFHPPAAIIDITPPIPAHPDPLNPLKPPPGMTADTAAFSPAAGTLPLQIIKLYFSWSSVCLLH